MYGWTGKFLRVNLTKSKITVEDTNPKIANDFIGARGMGVKYLYDEIDRGDVGREALRRCDHV